MRIGVMTFWWSEDNYGQLLQCYALQKYLRDLGHDAYLIRYYMDYRRLNFKKKFIKYGLHPWRLYDGIMRIWARKKGLRELERNSNGFDTFRKDYLKVSDRLYSSFDELVDHPPSADAYIVGSDQVWNVNDAFLPEDVRAYFLDFGRPETRRISYAASFGRSQVSNRVLADIGPLLKRFSLISVRERSGIDICRRCGVCAEWVCDPTLLLKQDAWLDLAEDPAERRPYVFAYMLTNECSFSLRKLTAWADAHGLAVVYVKGNSGARTNYEDEGFPMTMATIPQWLGYIANARYVVTNSFHCSVFAQVFGKKIGIVPLKGSFEESNNRIADLYSRSNARYIRIVDDDFEALCGLRVVEMNDFSGSGTAFLRAALECHD